MLCFHLVRRLVVLLEHLQQVAGYSPGYSRDAEMWGCMLMHTLSRARRVRTVNLDAVFARAAYTRRSATRVGNCQLGSLTTGSPAGHLLPYNADSRVSTAVCSSLAPSGDLLSQRTSLHVRNGGSMYSLACRTPGIIPWNYCSLRDHGYLKRVPWEAWTLL